MSIKKFFKWLNGLFFERVILCELDGVLIRTQSGELHPIDYDDWELIPEVIEALKTYKPSHIFIVTNQGFIDRVNFAKKMNGILDALQDILGEKVVIDYTYSTLGDDNEYFRKPNIGMIEYFRTNSILNYDFDKKNALFVGYSSGLEGDFSDIDKECAKNAGIEYMDVNEFVNNCLHPCNTCGWHSYYDCERCNGWQRKPINVKISNNINNTTPVNKTNEIDFEPKFTISYTETNSEIAKMFNL